MTIRRWFSTNWGWIGPGIGALVSVLLLVAVLTFGMRTVAREADDNLIADWNRTISKLGIEPVFPPEEDIYVGDIFAVVTKDRYNDDTDKSNSSHLQKKALAGRAVKLDHFDVTDIIKQYYSQLPIFADTTTRPVSERDVWAQLPEDDMFDHQSQRKTLALAAFPGFSIKHSKAASSDASSSWLGRLRLSLERNDSEEFQIPFAETYGLPTMLAAGILERYCTDPFTGDVCLDSNLRKHLSFVLGDSVQERLAPGQDFRFNVEIELVNRVYLTRAINRRRGEGSSNELGSGPKDAPPTANAGQANQAAQLTGTSQASRSPETPIEIRSSFKSEGGSDVSLDRTFQRPVVFGYRAVRYSWGDIQGDLPTGSHPVANEAIVR